MASLADILTTSTEALNGSPTDLLPFSGSFGTGQITFFESDDTFVVPDGIEYVRVRLWGGGGGSFRDSGSSDTFGGGGGGFALKICKVSPGDSVSVTVGAAGEFLDRGIPGSDGGTSSFGSFFSATGGEGGSSSGPSLGGEGIGGDINFKGGGTLFATGGIESTGGSSGSLLGNGSSPDNPQRFLDFAPVTDNGFLDFLYGRGDDDSGPGFPGGGLRGDSFSGPVPAESGLVIVEW